MRRFMKVFQVKRHAMYVLVQDGEAGTFTVLRWDAEQGSKPRPVGRAYAYEIGNEEEKSKARSQAFFAAAYMSEQARGWMEAGKDAELPRTLQEAERDFRSYVEAMTPEEERPLSLSEALELDRAAFKTAQALDAEEQEATKAAVIREELSPAAQRRPAPQRR